MGGAMKTDNVIMDGVRDSNMRQRSMKTPVVMTLKLLEPVESATDTYSIIPKIKYPDKAEDASRQRYL